MSDVRRIADDVIEVRVPSVAEANALAEKLRSTEIGAIADDVVAGFESICISAAPEHICDIFARLQDLPGTIVSPESEGDCVEVPVSYGGENGPDIASVCDALGVQPTDFVDLHAGRLHRVDLIGFTPGFTYLSGLPADFAIPRRKMPRPRLAAGSIGVSGAFTGIYAMAGPGGWPVVGRTSLVLFDAAQTSPFRLRPGMQVRFVPDGPVG